LFATAVAAQVGVRPDSIIDLVYLGGPDCRYCRAWEAKELPTLRKMEEFKHIRFTHVLKKIPQPVPPSTQLPAHLKPMYDQMVRQTRGRGGSPQFVLLLDGVAVHGGFGTQAFHELLPAMTKLVTNKTGKPISISDSRMKDEPRSAGDSSPITHHWALDQSVLLVRPEIGRRNPICAWKGITIWQTRTIRRNPFSILS